MREMKFADRHREITYCFINYKERYIFSKVYDGNKKKKKKIMIPVMYVSFQTS